MEKVKKAFFEDGGWVHLVWIVPTVMFLGIIGWGMYTGNLAQS